MAAPWRSSHATCATHIHPTHTHRPPPTHPHSHPHPTRPSQVGAENCFGTWLYSYASQSLRLTPAAAATAVSLFWGSFTAGRLVSVPLSAKLAPDRMLAFSLPLAVAGARMARRRRKLKHRCLLCIIDDGCRRRRRDGGGVRCGRVAPLTRSSSFLVPL